jgi:hypothetical protein
MDDTTQDLSRRGLFHILGSAAVTAGALTAQTHDHAVGRTDAPPMAFKRKTFDDHQWATVRVLCDLIIPADESSGSASQAGVPEFIDDWLDFRKQEDGNFNFGAQIVGGLAWLDHASNDLFQKSFADAAAAEQKQILDRIAWPDRASAEDKPWVHFFSAFRDLTVSGFASSKVGIADLPYLGNKAVAAWKGCDPKVWAILEERMKNGYKGIGGEVKPWSV